MKYIFFNIWLLCASSFMNTRKKLKFKVHTGSVSEMHFKIVQKLAKICQILILQFLAVFFFLNFSAKSDWLFRPPPQIWWPQARDGRIFQLTVFNVCCYPDHPINPVEALKQRQWSSFCPDRKLAFRTQRPKLACHWSFLPE